MSEVVYFDTSALAKWYMNESCSDQEDIRRRFLICYPLPAGLAMGAVNLMAFLPDISVRALDAMHLVIAKEIGAEVLATADRIMAEAGKALSLKVARF